MKREWAEQVHTPEAKSTRSSTPRCVVPTGLAFGVWSWGLWPARIDQTNWQPRTAASKIFHGCQACLLAFETSVIGAFDDLSHFLRAAFPVLPRHGWAWDK